MAIFELGIRVGFDRVPEGFTGDPSPTVRFLSDRWWDRGRTVVAPWSDHPGPRLTSSIENHIIKPSYHMIHMESELQSLGGAIPRQITSTASMENYNSHYIRGHL